METQEIYTDGGSRGNPGLGGWAFYNETFGEGLSGVKEVATNNEMELTAIYEGLSHIKLHNSDIKVMIYSDSSYCVNTLSSWYYNWRRNGTLSMRPNHELITKIMDLIEHLKSHHVVVEFKKVKGHSGVPGNERVDRMLNEAMDNFINYVSHPNPILPTNLIITDYIVGRSLNGELYIDATLSDGSKRIFKEI